MSELEGKRVFVTGSGAGIGKAIATLFTQRGARVVVSDINADAAEQTAAEIGAAGVANCDVTDEAQVQSAIAQAVEILGGLDVLVNNAGIAGATAPVADYPPDTWNAVIGVNLTGTFMVTQRAIPLLRQSPAASIIVMSSLAGRFGYANRVAYSTTKWGLVGLTKTLSLELGPLGITANSIHPGAVDGPRIQRVFEERARASGRTVREETDLALANQSVKQFVNPADIAALAVFLAGPHARSISGQMFPIDGDSKAA